ncbi:MAG: S46 family peptidase [Rhodothermaceae bacterium]
MKQFSKLFKIALLLNLSLLMVFTSAQTKKYESQKFDTGKMWTFEDISTDYLNETYGFNPAPEWFDAVRLSALKFGSWCSSSFVSADGLLMTNHHCVDFITSRIQKEGENIKVNGFYAPTLADERKVPGLKVDQLVLIEDVTEQVISAMAEGKTNEEKLTLKKETIKKLEKEYSDDSELICKVTELYQGGKYSLYGYRRYTDVRFVFVAENDIGFFGGIEDNFTFPRYNLDCSFLRVYEDGKPVKTDNFFKWSANGAVEGEPLFVVGNPGTTERLKTVAQLEYLRDVTYKNRALYYQGIVAYLSKAIEREPENLELKSGLIHVANGEKVFSGKYNGLLEEGLIERKKDFEEKFKAKVMANPELKEKYGHLWNSIAQVKEEQRKYANYINACSIYRNAPDYFVMAKKLVNMAEELKKDDADRKDEYKDANIEKTISGLFPEEIDEQIEFDKLKLQAKMIAMNLGLENEIVTKLFGGKKCKEAVQYIVDNTLLKDKEAVTKLAKEGADAILASEDPIISFIVNTKDDLKKKMKLMNDTRKTEEALENELGQALFAVYGVSIPPDATFTLRINDGVMKGHKYNGTFAPSKTTFYGLYDRYNSFDKKFPWTLPESWKNPGDLKLGTPFNFISTHDIVGGSSGSAVINKNGEIVGLAFDGNISSIKGSFVYTYETARMVSVASQGMLEALRAIYKADRIVKELKAGKIK